MVNWLVDPGCQTKASALNIEDILELERSRLSNVCFVFVFFLKYVLFSLPFFTCPIGYSIRFNRTYLECGK